MGEKYISKIAQGDNTYYIKDLNAVSGSSLTSNNIIIGGGNSSVSASGKSIETSLTANSDNAVPTSKAVATYVATNIANATRYKGGFNANSSNGTIDGGNTTLKSVKEVIGDMYTVTTAGTFLGQSLEVGDSIIFKADVAAGTSPIASNVVFVEGTTSVSVPSTTPTLSWGQTSTIGTVEGVDLKITMPSAISVMGASGSSHASGLVPDTPTTEGNKKFLCENATWSNPFYETVDLLPVVYGVDDLTNALMPDTGIIYNYTNDTFYYYSSENTTWISFTRPTWTAFCYYVKNDNKLYLKHENTVEEVTGYSMFTNNTLFVWWYSYNNPGPISADFFGEQAIDFIPFSNINDTTYTLNILGLPAGTTTATSLNSIPIERRVCEVRLDSNLAVTSLNGVEVNNGIPDFGNFTPGSELHVFALTSYSTITVVLPTNYPYMLCGEEDTYTLSPGEILEINFVRAGDKIYVRAIASSATLNY